MPTRLLRFTIFALLFAAGTLLASLSPPPAAAQEEQTGPSGTLILDEHLAKDLAEKGDWGGLHSLATGWTENDGANWESWYYLGLAGLRLGKGEEAAAALNTSLKLSPRQNDELLRILADTYMLISNWTAAENHYRRLVEKYPSNAELWENMRVALEEQHKAGGNVDAIELKLITVLEKQLTSFGDYTQNLELWRRYAELLAKHEGGEKTRRAYTQVLSLDRENLAVVEWMFRYDLEHADEETLDKTIAYLGRIDPNNPPMRMYLAKKRLAKGDDDGARAHYEAVAASQGYNVERARALAILGDSAPLTNIDESLSYYRQAIAADPSYLYPWQQIVILLRGQRKVQEAQRYLSRLTHIQAILKSGETLPPDIAAGF